MKRVPRKLKRPRPRDLTTLVHGAVMGMGMVALGASLLSGLVAKRVFGDKKPTPTKTARRVPHV